MFTQSVSSTCMPLINFNSAEEITALNSPEILLKIFVQLNMQDLNTISLVCRDWKHVINNHQEILFPIFSQLNNNSNFLKEFNIIYSNIEKFEEANFYLIGEKHGSQNCKDLFNYLLARLLIHHHVIVLVEGSPSMQKITENFDCWLKAYNIPITLREKITFIGWDYEHLDEIGNPPEVQRLLHEQIIQCSDWIKEIDQEISKISPDLSDETLLKLSISDLKLIAELRRRQTKLRKLQKKWLTEFNKGMATEEEIIRTYPVRTNRMVKTLKTIQSMIQSGECVAKIVLQSGVCHLNTPQKYIDTPEMKLDELYQTLDSLKAIVMIPNQVMEEFP